MTSEQTIAGIVMTSALAGVVLGGIAASFSYLTAINVLLRRNRDLNRRINNLLEWDEDFDLSAIEQKRI